MADKEFKTPQDALAHYGKKGMKWGVRNDRKTGSEREAAKAEKKQAKKDTKLAELSSQAAKIDIRIKEIDAELATVPKGSGVRNAMKRQDLKTQRNEMLNYKNSLEKTAQAIESGRLTPNQKALLIGGALVGGMLVVGYGNSKFESGEAQAWIAQGKARLTGKPIEFRKNDAFANASDPDTVRDLVASGINPNYKERGGVMNCRRCTFTYELRRRGYDVTATTSAVGYGQSESGLINALTPGKRNYNAATSLSTNVSLGNGIRAKALGDRRKGYDAETFSVPDAKDRMAFLNVLKQQPDGARGEAVFNFGGFAHSLAYERFGNKAYIFDTQKGQRYDVDSPEYDSFLQKWGYSSVKDVQVTRLDNANLDLKFLARWSTDKSSGEGAREPRSRTQAPASRSTTKTPTTASFRQLTPAQILTALGPRPPDMHITTYNALRRKAGFV